MSVRGALTALACAGAAVVAIALLPGAARADFTATFCANSPAPPWVEGADGASPWSQTFDGCSTAGGLGGNQYGFDEATSTLPPGQWAAGIDAPPGETFTGVSLNWNAEPVSNAPAYITWGYGANDPLFPVVSIGNPATSGTFAASLPNTDQFWARYNCDAPQGSTCNLASFINALAIGTISLTVHDTTVPSASATGGSMAANGATVKGTQTLLFRASDSGSGVAKTTVSLGSTVVGETDSTCQTASLTPCPADTAGSVVANTAAVPDGTYPVILTAYDASGDAAPVQAATVVVDNRSGTTSLPHPTRTHHRHAVDVHVVFHWDRQARSTLLKSVSIGHTSRSTHLTLSCTGRHCPFTRLGAGHRSIKRLERRLRHRRFRPGQRLHYLATAPHRRSQRATMTIRSKQLPRVTVPR